MQPIAYNNRNILDDLQKTTFSTILYFTIVVTWLWIIVGSTLQAVLPGKIIVLNLTIEALCGLCVWFQRNHFRATRSAFVICLWLLNATAVLTFEATFLLYFFALVSLLTTLIIRPQTAIVLSLLSTFLILHQVSSFWLAVPSIMVMWLVLFTTIISFQNILKALDIIADYEEYAVAQMDEARTHRGQLMKLTKALKQANDDLENLNSQLVYARHAADQARQLKAQFAANVSHELRTPINLVVGFSEMLINGTRLYGTPLPSPYWVDVNTIYRNAKHLQSLINDILDISQIDAGHMAIVREESDLRQILLEVVEMVADLIKSNGLILVLNIPDLLPPIWLDRVRIRQVLLNLFSNAIRFTSNGAITLSALVEPEWVKISVADSGVGIQEPELKRIFEEFYQVSSTAPHHGTSGLGLALTRSFVQIHGGRIWVESDGIPGKGSTFHFILPLESRLAVWANTTTGDPNIGKKSVVVLDTDPAVIQLFERYATDWRVIGAQTIEEAKRLVIRIQPIALVMDPVNSANNLFTISPWVNALAQSPRTTLITCSMPSSRRAMQFDGTTDYLVKPVTERALVQSIRRLPGTVRNILIIDDDPDIVRMFTHMLQNVVEPVRYQIWKAYSGDEGLMLMQTQRPDAVILDVVMPGTDGLKVLETMKADPNLAAIPVVITSARGAYDALTTTINGQITLQKQIGFQPIELVRCIDALVGLLSTSDTTIVP